MSNGALRKGDTLTGQAGEHGGHYYYDEDDNRYESHPSVSITGYVNEGSPNVFINGKPAARQGDNTAEFDACTNGTGTITSGSGRVKINGKSATRQKDNLSTHAGSGSFNSSSSNVIIGD